MGEDENEVWLVSKDSEVKLERASKDEIAKQIVTIIGKMI
jgi:phosphopantothenoylcysteine synthetase/decarboxylase